MLTTVAHDAAYGQLLQKRRCVNTQDAAVDASAILLPNVPWKIFFVLDTIELARFYTFIKRRNKFWRNNNLERNAKLERESWLKQKKRQAFLRIYLRLGDGDENAKEEKKKKKKKGKTQNVLAEVIKSSVWPGRRQIDFLRNYFYCLNRAEKKRKQPWNTRRLLSRRWFRRKPIVQDNVKSYFS